MPSPNNKSLILSLKHLDKTLKQHSSFKQSFLRGLYSGIGSAIGATIVAGIVVSIILRLISTARQIPFVDQFIQNIPIENTLP